MIKKFIEKVNLIFKKIFTTKSWGEWDLSACKG